MFFERYDDVGKAAAKIRFVIVAERIDHDGKRHELAGDGDLVDIYVKRSPVSAREERVAAHGVPIGETRDRSLDDPTPAARELPRDTELGMRLRVPRVRVPRQGLTLTLTQTLTRGREHAFRSRNIDPR
jgi:hypothetical protein